MSKNLNKVLLIGHLGADADYRVGQSGNAAATFNVATSESFKDKDGNPVERTEWHRCKTFGKLADVVRDHFKKGREVYVEGQLRTSKYTDKEGIERYSTEIVVNTAFLLGGKPAEAGNPPAEG